MPTVETRRRKRARSIHDYEYVYPSPLKPQFPPPRRRSPWKKAVRWILTLLLLWLAYRTAYALTTTHTLPTANNLATNPTTSNPGTPQTIWTKVNSIWASTTNTWQTTTITLRLAALEGHISNARALVDKDIERVKTGVQESWSWSLEGIKDSYTGFLSLGRLERLKGFLDGAAAVVEEERKARG